MQVDNDNKQKYIELKAKYGWIVEYIVRDIKKRVTAGQDIKAVRQMTADSIKSLPPCSERDALTAWADKWAVNAYKNVYNRAPD